MKKKLIIGIILIMVLVAAIAGVIFWRVNNKSELPKSVGKVDDWKYDGPTSSSGGWFSGFGSTAGTTNKGAIMATESAVADSTIGLSTGGAKDVNNFRGNIKNGYFPISTDITYNGLFYDYVFDTKTNTQGESNDLFSPAYSTAVSKDPISENNEYYMTVGLNSNIKESDFARKKLNLVVVLDISGSMSSELDSYYYDDPTQEVETKSKMQLASESVNILLDQLKDDDRFGMVLFDDAAYLGKEISTVGETDIDAIKNHILEIQALGGTNFESGYTKATELFKEYVNADKEEYENRIIVITDAMPNYGTTSKEGILEYVDNNSRDGIYTTFIGVGVDFNTELIEQISDVKGANYYSVSSEEEFKSRMGEQFEYMVTPLVFDLEMNLESNCFEIAEVYGSDTVNKTNGNVMKVNTLFPSKTTDTGEVKGGVVLLKLKRKVENVENESVKLKVSYATRDGQQHESSQEVTINTGNDEHYDNTGIRKAIVLTRYANTVKNWILYERTEKEKFLIIPTTGIIDCNYNKDEIRVFLGENERQSVNLSVSEKYKEIFNEIKEYINKENEVLKDETFKQEIEILDLLVK